MIRRAGCRFENLLPEMPIHIFKPEPQGSQMVALVPCEGFSARGIALTLNRSGEEPGLMFFPVITPPQGIGMMYTPGFLRWDAGAKTLIATEGSDMCPDLLRQYTYRYRDNTGLRSGAIVNWVLMKVEVAHSSCGSNNKWMTYWEAPIFPDLPRPN